MSERLTVREMLDDLANKSGAFHVALRDALYVIQDAATKEWPAAPAYAVQWRDRAEVPPAGRIWASDGEMVWLLWSDGRPISAEAVRVRYWTDALIPAPPKVPA